MRPTGRGHSYDVSLSILLGVVYALAKGLGLKTNEAVLRRNSSVINDAKPRRHAYYPNEILRAKREAERRKWEAVRD